MSSTVLLLGLEYLDELWSGATSVAAPVIRSDLGLTYAALTLVTLSGPSVLALWIEPPLLLWLAGRGGRMRLPVAALCLSAGLMAAAFATGPTGLLLGMTFAFVASGVCTSLAQVHLMEADTERREVWMARWGLAGALGDLSAPLVVVLAATISKGASWRVALSLCALGCAVHALVFTWRLARISHQLASGSRRDSASQDFRRPTEYSLYLRGRRKCCEVEDQARRRDVGEISGLASEVADGASHKREAGPCEADAGAARPPLRQALVAATRNRRLLGWLIAGLFCTPLDEILVTFGALHMRDTLGWDGPARSAALFACSLGAALGLLIAERLLASMEALWLLSGSAVACGAAFVAWWSCSDPTVGTVMLFLVGMTAAPHYPIVQAQAYRAMPEAAIVVAVVGGLLESLALVMPPLLGMIADHHGLPAATALLLVQPLALLCAAWGLRSAR